MRARMESSTIKFCPRAFFARTPAVMSWSRVLEELKVDHNQPSVRGVDDAVLLLWRAGVSYGGGGGMMVETGAQEEDGREKAARESDDKYERT